MVGDNTTPVAGVIKDYGQGARRDTDEQSGGIDPLDPFLIQ